MWETFGNASSILADVATAIAVVFGGWQLLELNRRGRIESHLNLVQSEREIWLAALATPDISETVVDEVWGISSPKNATTNLFWAVFMDSCEHMYLRHRARIMSRADWRSMENYIGRLAKSPSFRASWTDIRGDYVADFADYLDGRMGE